MTRTVRFRAPKNLAARLARLAVKKQGTSSAGGIIAREAALIYVDREEKQLKLDPITDLEVSELLNGKEAKAA